MITDPTTCPGSGEVFKAAVHLGAFTLCGIMAAYNALAWTTRRERRLLVNTGAYVLAMGFELRQIQRHWESRA